MNVELKQRIALAHELYMQGLSLLRVGQWLKPACSGHQVRRYLEMGVEANLFPRPNRPTGPPVTEEMVRETMLKTGNRERCAQILKIGYKSLEDRFGNALDEIERGRRLERLARRRSAILAEYYGLSRKLGYAPTSSDFRTTSLYARICRFYGSFTAFLRDESIVPRRLRQRF